MIIAIYLLTQLNGVYISRPVYLWDLLFVWAFTVVQTCSWSLFIFGAAKSILFLYFNFTWFILLLQWYVVDNRHIFTFLRHMIGWLKWNIKRKNYYIFSWRKFQGKTGSDNTKSLMNLSIIPGYNKNVRFGLPDWKLSQSTT